ncbi:MAG TPA: TonB-dependent receptor [Chryseosolibacter sp.]|nr:TonB-dependent receptor [Chryseosolibacter sp.]
MHSTIVLLLVFTSFCASALCQGSCQGVFTGELKSSTDEPIIGAAIQLSPSGAAQVSDVSGAFRFNNICAGKYRVKIQYLGYHDAEFDIEIRGQVHRVVHMREDVRQLQEVVIQHHDERHTEHASNFVQLDERQLGESAGKSIGAALREIPGVNTIQAGPGVFKPVIHGLHSQRILILNHGIRQEGQQWGAEHAPEIDPFIASNIIVIKDASAIRYGTDALGGVIIVNPPVLPETPGLSGTLNAVVQSNGRSGTISGMLEGGIRGQEGWGWRVQGTGKKSGDFHTPRYNLTNTGIEELNFSAATGYHKERYGVDVFFSHFQTVIGILKGTSISSPEDLAQAMERDVPLYTADFSYDISEPRQSVTHDLLKVNGHVATEAGEWRMQYGYQINRRKEFDIRIGELSDIPALDLQLNTHTLDTEWETKHSDRRTFSFGINGMFQNNENIFGTQRIPFIPNFRSVSAGMFGVGKFYFGTWTIDGGVRYDYRYYSVKGYDFKNSLYDAAFDFYNASATIGASKRMRKNQSVTFNLSTAWRPPHVAELYSIGTHQSAASIEYGLLLNDSTNEVMDIADVSFHTEKAVKFVSSYHRAWQNFSMEITPYANFVMNYIYLRPSGVTTTRRGVYPYFRYAQTDALFTGADITAHWHIGRHLKFIPKASLLRASDMRNEGHLVFIPANRYQVALRYEKSTAGMFKNLYIESKKRYVARQQRAPRVVTVWDIQQAREEGRNPFQEDPSNADFMAAPDGYFLWDISAGTSLKREKVQYDVRLSIENTLDRTYREYTNRMRYYADEPGRNIILSFKCIF